MKRALNLFFLLSLVLQVLAVFPQIDLRLAADHPTNANGGRLGGLTLTLFTSKLTFDKNFFGEILTGATPEEKKQQLVGRSAERLDARRGLTLTLARLQLYGMRIGR
jgi:hypothetical protein